MLASVLNQEELCQGCLSAKDLEYRTCYVSGIYNGKYVSKVFKYGDLDIIKNCPCVLCIVKPICKKFCKSYQTYALKW
jgi:hypothetical protein